MSESTITEIDAQSELQGHREQLRRMLEAGGHYVIVIGMYQPYTEVDYFAPYVMVGQGEGWPYMQWLGGHARHLIGYRFDDRNDAFAIGGGGYSKPEALVGLLYRAAYGDNPPDYRVQTIALSGRFGR